MTGAMAKKMPLFEIAWCALAILAPLPIEHVETDVREGDAVMDKVKQLKARFVANHWREHSSRGQKVADDEGEEMSELRPKVPAPRLGAPVCHSPETGAAGRAERVREKVGAG